MLPMYLISQVFQRQSIYSVRYLYFEGSDHHAEDPKSFPQSIQYFVELKNSDLENSIMQVPKQ